MDKSLHVTPMQYTLQAGQQTDSISKDTLDRGESFETTETSTELNRQSVHSRVKYDLVGKIAESVKLTRKTVSEILSKIDKTTFALFKVNPESFLAEAVRLIGEQKATVIGRTSHL